MTDFLHSEKPLRFLFPIDGDCLMSADGAEKDGVFFVHAVLNAPCKVNGVEARKDGARYVCEVPFCETLTATDGVNTDTVRVFDMRRYEKKYRVSSDDNILFLRDINDNKDVYRSIFDNPYLAVYKKAHDLYGAKVDLNLFYETDDMPCFAVRGKYFNLSMMTDRFKPEFEANSDWLRLSFHANSEHPDRPYMYTSPQRITEDALRVHAQIIRFAGKKTLSDTATVHWGEAARPCTQAMRDMGYGALAGYFEFYKGKPFVAYYYPEELVSHVEGRDFWVNTEDGILHSHIDIVLNTLHGMDELPPALDAIYADPHRSGFMEFMIHEQYFYDCYTAYRPHFEQLVLDSVGSAYDRGYTGSFYKL